ncbi:unnamed protein product [Didymodactylos carnosus]|uniref:Uncharacterized protein n=1 Tax=Didymodactylos carnosus TaxID=1234261 RepID=A0A814A871_9BILA|nr:unnamed protein product [Didymodactylos carnosus]CAF3690122.1 unnamed protein product [Didymodactylos carnosus]
MTCHYHSSPDKQEDSINESLVNDSINQYYELVRYINNNMIQQSDFQQRANQIINKLDDMHVKMLSVIQMNNSMQKTDHLFINTSGVKRKEYDENLDLTAVIKSNKVAKAE